MSFPIRPGKVTCAGLVAILMVLPNTIWKGSNPRVEPKAMKFEKRVESVRSGVKYRKLTR